MINDEKCLENEPTRKNDEKCNPNVEYDEFEGGEDEKGVKDEKSEKNDHSECEIVKINASNENVKPQKIAPETATENIKSPENPKKRPKFWTFGKKLGASTGDKITNFVEKKYQTTDTKPPPLR